MLKCPICEQTLLAQAPEGGSAIAENSSLSVWRSTRPKIARPVLCLTVR